MKPDTHPTNAPTKGFSLIELIVVIAILSVVLSIGTSMFFKIMDVGNYSARALRMEEKVNTVFAKMREDFSWMLSTEQGGMTLSGEHGEVQDDALAWGMKLENDRVTLAVAATDPSADVLEKWSVLYQIGRDEQGQRRLERWQAPLGYDATDGGVEVVAEWVTAMGIEYHDGISWRPSWNKNQAPRAVRISLTLMSPNRPSEQIARKAAFTLHVK